MSRTPITDARITELEELADMAKERGDPGEISYRMSLVGWQFMKSLEIERLAAWFSKRLGAPKR